MVHDLFYRSRIFIVHFTYMLYSAVLWYKLIEVGKATNHPVSQTIIPCALWSCGFIFINLLFCFATIRQSPPLMLQKTWINIPMLMFTIFNLPPFGYTLNHLYEVAQDATTENSHRQNLAMIDFIILQMSMPVLLITFIVYPLPRRSYRSSEYLAVALEFMNAFDIMDIVSDIAYIRHYELIWMIVFYLSLGVSVILLSFPVKIETKDLVWLRRVVICSPSQSEFMTSSTSVEQIDRVVEVGELPQSLSVTLKDVERIFEGTLHNSEEKRSEVIHNTFASQQKEVYDRKRQEMKIDPRPKSKMDRSASVWRKILKASLTMIFMDAMFASIRLKIMLSERSAEHGFNMFVKNVILAALHFSYLTQHVHCLVYKTYAKDFLG